MNKKKKRSHSRLRKLPDELRGCLDILRILQSKPNVYPFLEPVDWKNLNLPDYPTIVKRPMDLGTIEDRIYSGLYSSADEFAEDVRLVWHNAQTYNQPGSDIWKWAETLSIIFERHFSKLSRSNANNKRRRVARCRAATRQDRISFSSALESLPTSELVLVASTIYEQCPGAITETDSAVEIEVNRIESATLLDLNRYLLDRRRKRESKKREVV